MKVQQDGPLGETGDGRHQFRDFGQTAAAVKLCLVDMDDRNADAAGGQ